MSCSAGLPLFRETLQLRSSSNELYSVYKKDLKIYWPNKLVTADLQLH